MANSVHYPPSAAMTSSRTLTRLVRLGWLAILLMTLVVFLAGLIAWYPPLLEICHETQQVCQQQLRLTVYEYQALVDQGWSIEGYAVYNLLVRLLSKLLGVVLGVLIFWRLPVSRISVVASLFLIIGLETSIAEGLIKALPGWRLPANFLMYVGGICFGFFFYLFPGGSFIPGWSRWAAGLWAVIYFFPSFLPGSFLSINSWPVALVFSVMFVFLASLVFSQVHRYRWVSSPIERAQTRWVVIASAVSISILFLNLIFVMYGARNLGISGRITPFWFLFDLGFQQMSFLIPISISIAIVRYRLFEIDIIIRRTLVYTLLTAWMALVYMGTVTVLQRLFQSVSGQSSTIAIILSTLAIAALFNPLRHRIQAFIDRRFYRQKYNAEKALAGFAALARSETDLAHLSTHLLTITEATLSPAHVSLWMRPGPPKPGERDVAGA